MNTSIKSFYLILLVLLLVSSMIGCSKSPDGNSKSPDEQEISYHAIAADKKYSGASAKECIEIQEKAVEQMRQGKAKESAMEVLSQMGYFYSRNGEYQKGLLYLQEATDSMHNTPEDSLNTKAAIRLLGNTANLYCRMGLYKEALSLNLEAIEMSERTNDTSTSDLWRMRAIVFEKQSKPDSALMCYQQAIKAAHKVRDPELARIQRIWSENAHAYFLIENYDYMPDSIAAAIATLERNLGKSILSTTDSLLIGRGYVLTGNAAKGIEMMKATLPSYRKRGSEDLEFALRLLSQSLIESQLPPSSVKIYKESRILSDSMTAELKNHALLGADFNYRTSQISNEKKLLEMKLSQTRERIIYSCILIFTIIGVTAAYFIHRYRSQRQLLTEKQASLQRLIDDRINLNKRIEELNRQLINNNRTENDSSDEDKEPLLNMTLLTKTDENRFRQLFGGINPGFIERIRVNYPGISGGNEIICMMIRLHKSNEEISLALGIKRESVAKARYRLRTLFNLPKEVELNDFIASL